MKTCRKCGLDKPEDEFYSNGNYIRPECISCTAKYKAARHVADPSYRRTHSLKTKFGLKPYDYDFILAFQNWRCACCGTDVPRGQGSFHVDHSHSTGQVRGILCMVCNMRLGFYESNNSDLEHYLRTR